MNIARHRVVKGVVATAAVTALAYLSLALLVALQLKPATEAITELAGPVGRWVPVGHMAPGLVPGGNYEWGLECREPSGGTCPVIVPVTPPEHWDAWSGWWYVVRTQSPFFAACWAVGHLGVCAVVAAIARATAGSARRFGSLWLRTSVMAALVCWCLPSLARLLHIFWWSMTWDAMTHGRPDPQLALGAAGIGGMRVGIALIYATIIVLIARRVATGRLLRPDRRKWVLPAFSVVILCFLAAPLVLSLMGAALPEAWVQSIGDRWYALVGPN